MTCKHMWKKVHTVFFHFYEIQEQVDLIYGANIRMGAELSIKRSMREHSGVMKSVLYLELGDSIMNMYICQNSANYSSPHPPPTVLLSALTVTHSQLWSNMENST